MFRYMLAVAVATILTVVTISTTLADDTHAGLVVQVVNGELHMTDMQGAKPHVHKVTSQATIKRNNAPAKLNDLMKGDRIKVTTRKQGDTDEVVAIEASG